MNICVVGLGYVGLPLAVAFSEKYQVIGIDIDSDRISDLKKSVDKTLEVETSDLEAVEGKLKFTDSMSDTTDSNVYIITVPTPIDSDNKPDLSPLINSSKSVGGVISAGDIVIYESTVYPGATEEVCVPELEKASGMVFNKDFFCGYSPERINPGDKEHTVKNILKVTSGSTPEIATIVDDLYKSIITAGTHLAPSIKVAEASKIIENTQRDMNIALINEVAIIFNKMGICTKDVIEAAATKWNFIKLMPGLVGGHCIGVDPYYLIHKAQEIGYDPQLILNSRRINNHMSKYIADITVKEMIQREVNIKDSKILMLGITFKENCPDMRNTKVIDLIDELKQFGCSVDVFDPWVDIDAESSWYKHGIIPNPLKSNKKYDSIVVAVSHDQFVSYSEEDYDYLSKASPIIIDIKGIVSKPTWRL